MFYNYIDVTKQHGWGRSSLPCASKHSRSHFPNKIFENFQLPLRFMSFPDNPVAAVQTQLKRRVFWNVLFCHDFLNLHVENDDSFTCQKMSRFLLPLSIWLKLLCRSVDLMWSWCHLIALGVFMNHFPTMKIWKHAHIGFMWWIWWTENQTSGAVLASTLDLEECKNRNWEHLFCLCLCCKGNGFVA